MKCNGCTICCDLLPVPVLDKKAWEVCAHCENGCKIHDTKPDFCKSFNCMYAQSENLPIRLRPDNCGIMFEKMNDQVIFALQSNSKWPIPLAFRQIESFMQQGFSIIYKEKGNTPRIYLNGKHIKSDIEQAIKKRVNGDIRN